MQTSLLAFLNGKQKPVSGGGGGCRVSGQFKKPTDPIKPFTQAELEERRARMRRYLGEFTTNVVEPLCRGVEERARAAEAMASSEGEAEAASGQELVPHLSEMYDDEGGSSTEPSDEVEGQPPGLLDSTGDAQGRDTAPASHSASSQTTKNKRSEMLRLRVWEAWELSTRQEPVCCVQLSSQIGQELYTAWEYPRSRILNAPSTSEAACIQPRDYWSWHPKAIQGVKNCHRVTLWCLPRRDSKSRPWLLLAKQTQNRRVSCVLYSPQDQRELEDVAFPSGLPGPRSVYLSGYRVVEIKYQAEETLQGDSALHFWAHQTFQDHDGRVSQAIFESLRHPERGGFLRSMGELLLRLGADGRVQGQQDHPVDERVPAGVGDEPETEGETDSEDDQHSGDNPGKLSPEPVVSKDSRKRPNQVRDSFQPFTSDKPRKTARYTWARCGTRLCKLSSDERLSPSPPVTCLSDHLLDAVEHSRE